MSSLDALRRKVNLDTLAHLQPLLLLQMLAGVSQTVNSSVSNSRALARTLLLSGQQRLRELLDATPRLHLSVERVLELCRTNDAQHTQEETAAQALFELCLGLMLHWMAEQTGQRHTIVTPCSGPRVSYSYFLASPSLCRPQARSCLSPSLA